MCRAVLRRGDAAPGSWRPTPKGVYAQCYREGSKTREVATQHVADRGRSLHQSATQPQRGMPTRAGKSIEGLGIPFASPPVCVSLPQACPSLTPKVGPHTRIAFFRFSARSKRAASVLAARRSMTPRYRRGHAFGPESADERRIVAVVTAAALGGCGIPPQPMPLAPAPPSPPERRAESPPGTAPTCLSDRECELKWTAARQWVRANADMKLQHVTADFMETYNRRRIRRGLRSAW